MSFCPFSSCKEMERNDNGSRTGLMSASGRLVTGLGVASRQSPPKVIGLPRRTETKQKHLDIHPSYQQSDRLVVVLGDSTGSLNTGKGCHRLGFVHHCSVSNRKWKGYCSRNWTGRRVGIEPMKATHGGPSFDLSCNIGSWPSLRFHLA
jgi:hypothetical protein